MSKTKKIVGVSFYQCNFEILHPRLKVGESVVVNGKIVSEPENYIDINAKQILVDGVKIGYVPKSLNLLECDRDILVYIRRYCVYEQNKTAYTACYSEI